MKISVLGCGRWGSFITWYLSGKGHSVTEWGRESSEAYNELLKTGKNEYVTLSSAVELTSDLSYAVSRAEIVVISIKSQGLRELAQKIKAVGEGDKIFILCMKGIEEDSGKRLTEVMIDCGFSKDKIAVWVGPGHIQEFTAGKPNCMVIDGYNEELVRYLCDNLKGDLIRFYYGEDIIGSEIGAAAKNVMGIAAGILDGGDYKSLKGPLMARGAREVARLIKAMGGNELSAYGLCHLGDYETTLFSPHSNNRAFGEDLFLGKKFTKLAEGVSTAKAMVLLGKRYNVELPITTAVYNIIYLGNDPLAELLKLFSRETKPEFV
ncbi:MAG: NAD(P)-binding domain-containing protein [Clostridia bacterium]|nr:NAD(P)-binding domain-containing protein [Clostridia bacterium]MBR1677424.1 NAD(P)-binding domain-containing protein [Clostridia bacterium]